MEIRIMGSEDIAQVSRVYALSWKTAYRGIIPQSYLDELPEDRWVSALKNSPFTSLVLLDRGRYVGTSAFGEARDESLPGWGEIVSIYLLPEYFGRGYGQKLLDAVVSALAQRGYADIYLWVLADNLRARRFYEKNGFCHNGDTQTIDIGEAPLKGMRYVRHG